MAAVLLVARLLCSLRPLRSKCLACVVYSSHFQLSTFNFLWYHSVDALRADAHPYFFRTSRQTIAPRWLRTVGFNDAIITLSGRNLVTWTDYSGLDPESNLTGQSSGRGLEYFNNPQTRSWAISVALNR